MPATRASNSRRKSPTAARAPGEEIVQLYVNQRGTSVARPVRELKGFRRVALEPGQTRTVEFALGRDELAFWNIDMEHVVEPGELKIWVVRKLGSRDAGGTDDRVSGQRAPAPLQMFSSRLIISAVQQGSPDRSGGCRVLLRSWRTFQVRWLRSEGEARAAEEPSALGSLGEDLAKVLDRKLPQAFLFLDMQIPHREEGRLSRRGTSENWLPRFPPTARGRSCLATDPS